MRTHAHRNAHALTHSAESQQQQPKNKMKKNASMRTKWMIGVYLKNGLPLVLLIPFVLMLYCRGRRRRRCRRFFSLLLWSARFYRFVSYRIVAYYSGGSSSSMFLLLLLYDTQAHSLDDEMNWISHSAVNANYFPSRSFNLHEINHHTSITNKRTTGTHTHTYAYPQAYIGQMKCSSKF